MSFHSTAPGALPSWNESLYLPPVVAGEPQYSQSLDLIHKVYGGLVSCSAEEFRAQVQQQVVNEGGDGLDSLLHFLPRTLADTEQRHRQALNVVYSELFRVVLRMTDPGIEQGEGLWPQGRLLDILSLYGNQAQFFSRFTESSDNEAALEKALQFIESQRELFADADFPEYNQTLACLTRWNASRGPHKPSKPSSSSTASLRNSLGEFNLSVQQILL